MENTSRASLEKSDPPTCRLSVVLIARNEAENLPRCLNSVAFADEIIVLEHGSTDKTVLIAAGYGAKVSSTTDWPGFGIQKNRALAMAKGAWVLCLDADEVVTAELRAEICEIAGMGAGQADIDGGGFDARDESVAFEIPRTTQFRGEWIRHCGWTPDHVLRLIRRDTGRFTDDLVHERMVLHDPAAKAGRLKSPLLHYSYTKPDQYWIKLQRYSQDWARQRFERGQTTSMTRAVLAAVAAFLRTYVFRLGFLDGAMGFAVCWMQAQAAYSKYFELYCLNRQQRSL